MTYRVTVEPEGLQFTANAGEVLLDAALRQGVRMPHACREGTCGTCGVKVLQGEVESKSPSFTLQPEEGAVLLCQTRACSEIIIEALPKPVQALTMPCRVTSIVHTAPDVILLKLQPPRGTQLNYRAGQFLQVLLQGGIRRSYSMAAPANSTDSIELHIRHLPGGRFTDMLFGAAARKLKERDIVRVELPMGNFSLTDSDKPAVLLATGTGFAPIKAMIEDAMQRRITRPFSLYWGGRRASDLYMDTLAQKWMREIPHFRYVPVLSEPHPEDAWQGRTGFVHRAVMEDLPDLSGLEVYACGSPAMVQAARTDFVHQCNLPESAFFADAFTSDADRGLARL